MMTDSMKSKLKKILVKHEGFENFPYPDTQGKITIGIGYNLTDRGLPDAWINSQYDDDVNYFYTQLSEDFPWFSTLNEARQIVLINMCFMGYKSFKSFKKMLNALSISDFSEASYQMLRSKWATQVKSRANELSKIMMTGEI